MTTGRELPGDIRETVTRALKEDVGTGDLTAALVPDRPATATVVCREQAILCGRAWFDETFRQLDESIRTDWLVDDGEAVSSGQVICEARGSARSLLTGERTALNFLQTLSGTASEVHRYVDRIKGSGARILDTRKTLPGLRGAQKYAVRCGGGDNHRHGLYDGILIKENHVLAAGSINAAVQAALATKAGVMLQVETESVGEVEQALAAGAELILLDNFSLSQLREAVAIRERHRASGKRAYFEASGNIDLDNVRQVAETGVDRISIGGLTKHVRAIDLSMRFTFASGEGG